MVLAPDMVDLIDERILAHSERITAAGTVVTRTGATTASVTFDGSAVPTPVKVFGDVNIDEGDRVGLVQLGVDWTIVGTFTRRRNVTYPDGATTGTMREVLGATTPPELIAYGISVANLFYLTDSVTGVEVGYEFIGASNTVAAYPATSGYRALVFGNVTYPTPGNPASATVSNVKTAFQLNQFTESPYTIFKDQHILMYKGLGIELDGEIHNGTASLGRGVQARVDDGANSAAVGAEAVVLTLPGQTFRTARAFRVEVNAHYFQSGGSPATNTATVRVRKASLTGTLLLTYTLTNLVPGVDDYRPTIGYIKRTAPTDLSSNLVVTLQAGVNTVTQVGLRSAECADWNDANLYTNAPAII